MNKPSSSNVTSTKRKNHRRRISLTLTRGVAVVRFIRLVAAQDSGLNKGGSVPRRTDTRI